MQRIINVKPQMARASKMRKDFMQNHVAKRKMIMDKNQGIYVEDLISLKQRFREGTNRNKTLLPRIAPDTSKSMGPNTYQQTRRSMEEQSPTIPGYQNQAIMAIGPDPYDKINIQTTSSINNQRSIQVAPKSQLSANDPNGLSYGMPPHPNGSVRKNQNAQQEAQGRRTAELHRKKMNSITEMRNPIPKLE